MSDSTTSTLRNYWYPACTSQGLGKELPIGIDLFGVSVVVWRSNEAVHAWRDYCPHRGVKLSLGKVCGNRLRCAYHGWEYNQQGQCERIPASSSIRIPDRAKAETLYLAAEFGGLVWVCIGDEPAEKPSMPQYGNDQFQELGTGPHRVNTSFARMCENFLDISHVPFVHEGTIGIPEFPEIPDFKVDEIGGRPIVEVAKVTTPDFNNPGGHCETNFKYEVLSPVAVCYAASGTVGEPRNALMLAVRPISEEVTEVFFSMARRGNVSEVQLASALQFEVDVLVQDKPIVESQYPKRLPLNLRKEVHVKADALTSAWRRYLKRKNIQYGTIFE
jgi:phenylpropionate dioxygenase-like ring-hydroxylating dioxygenase large terminal subunit